MRRPLASVALSLLLTICLVAPTVAAHPSPSAGASSEPVATPSPDPTPAEPSATPEMTPAEPTPAGEPTPTSDPGPTADPASTADPDATADPAPTGNPSPAVDPVPAESADPTPATEPTAAPEPTPSPDPKAKPSSGEPVTDKDGRPIAAGRYIVILSGTADTASVISRHGKGEGIKADRKFDRVRAFAAKLDAAQRTALLSDPSVAAVVPDEVIQVTGQVNPTGVSRVGARLSPVADIDTIDDNRVDADVAIVDTGVALHPDLNVVGGVNCSTADRTKWQDENGHGTHVAGTVAAIDNTIGVVGVAPGARVWAVRILNSDGYGLLSWYVCGLDWILAQRDPADGTRPLIEAVNMSVAKSGSDDRNCGNTNNDILHKAICRLYNAGITVVAAAANEHASAANYVPAAYNEVITVSALADSDGKAGGLGGNRCFSWGTYDVDDTFADFSNYGGDVDIIAPGKCIWSTIRGPSYGYSSGTSMAAPAVTGAAALYKASRPLATPTQVRESLRYLGNSGWKTSTDPDSVHEPLLDVHRVGALGVFTVNVPATPFKVPSNGGTAIVPVTLVRSSTFFERVQLSFLDVPVGWGASFQTPSQFGWSATGTTATITVPPTAKPGLYTMAVVGTNWGRTGSSVITVDVSGDSPTAAPPIASILTRTTTGLLSSGLPTMSLRVSWPAATDPSDPIVGYQVQHSTNGGTWRTVSTAATTRSTTYSSLAAGSSHRFRVRALDTDGYWSPWAENPSPYLISSVGDRSSSLGYAGTWRKTTSSAAIGQTLTSSTSRGATMTYRFTGRAAAIVAPTSPTRGKATVYVDGVYKATIDLRTSTSRSRRVVYAISYATAGTHTIQLRVLGTSGRPTVSLDAVVILR
jgi:subtilisin family serine protease